jgi:hypothetical protein
MNLPALMAGVNLDDPHNTNNSDLHRNIVAGEKPCNCQ